MDSLSQITLGAAVGQLVVGKEAKNKALLWGAVAGTIPDLDILPGLFMETVDRIEIHRGFSHSFLFAFITSPIFGWLVSKLHKKLNISWKKWAWLFFWGIVSHFMLDNFTTWGTQVFYPFDYRVVWRTIFVIDPLYTLPFLFFIVWLAFLKDDQRRQKLNRLGLIISCSYLLITVVNKNIANSYFESELQRQEIEWLRYQSYATPFNSILWAVNVEVRDGFYVGYHSLFNIDEKIQFKFLPKNHQLIADLKEDEKLKRLIKLTQNWYTINQIKGKTYFNDLRFGVLDDPTSTDTNFVFSYLINSNIKDKKIYTEIERVDFTFDGRLTILIGLWNRLWGTNISTS